MTTASAVGRHRAPGRHNPLNELRLIAKESAQPVMKGAATIAAAGGLIASFGQGSAQTLNQPRTGTVEQASSTAPSAIGPTSTTTKASNALASIGYTGPAKSAAKPKAVVIEDLVAKDQQAKAARAKAAADAAAKARAAAAARAATAQQASRSTTRTAVSPTTGATPSATSGTRSSHNWATAGQCTWGALNKWYQSEGYYPGGWTGNALTWASGAANAGYTVSSVPRVRSIVVMQPGTYNRSSAGHVGWVTAVNGNQVTIVEMNALAGAYNYNTRTLTNVAGMRYIYAP